jgi:hypothetical protein
MSKNEPQIQQEHEERTRQRILELLRLVAREVVRQLEVRRDIKGQSEQPLLKTDTST